MKTQEEVSRIILEMQKNSRITTFRSYSPKSSSVYLYYFSITGFLDAKYFNLCIKKAVFDNAVLEVEICPLTDCRLMLIDYLETVSTLNLQLKTIETMEFKGTKGEWVYEGGDNNSIDIILPDDTTVSVDRQSRYSGVFVLSRKGMQANAKLIAASPYLLQELISTYESCLANSKTCEGVYKLAFEEIASGALKAINKALK